MSCFFSIKNKKIHTKKLCAKYHKKPKVYSFHLDIQCQICVKIMSCSQEEIGRILPVEKFSLKLSCCCQEKVVKGFSSRQKVIIHCCKISSCTQQDTDLILPVENSISLQYDFCRQEKWFSSRQILIIDYCKIFSCTIQEIGWILPVGNSSNSKRNCCQQEKNRQNTPISIGLM